MRIKDIQFLQEGGKTWDKFSIPQRKSYITKYLKNKGYSDIQTHAIIGNLQQENGRFDTGFTSHDGGFGIAQWTYHTRKKPLLKNPNHLDINVQLDYLDNEIKNGKGIWGNKKGGKNAFFNAKDLPTATEIFSRDFENPAQKWERLDKRIKYAYDSAGLKQSSIPKLEETKNEREIPTYTEMEYTKPEYNSIPIMEQNNYMIGLTQSIYDSINSKAEFDYQKEIKDKEEAELKSIQAQFEAKQQERQQFLSMIPQVNSVEAMDMIQPKIV